MTLRLFVVILIAACATAQPTIWFEPSEEDSPMRAFGSEDRQLTCYFEGRIGSQQVYSLFAWPSGIVTGDSVDSPGLKDGDEAAYNDLTTWFFAPLFASYKVDNIDFSCWKPSEVGALTDIIRNQLPDFEPSSTVAFTWNNMIFSDQESPIEFQLVLTSDYNGNAFILLSYKRDENNFPNDWRESIKRMAVKLPNSLTADYLNAVDISSLYGATNFDENQCCMFLMRVGDSSAELSKPVLPGNCDCSENELCTDDKAIMKQKCVPTETSPEEPDPIQPPQEPETDSCGSLTTCNAFATCSDVDGARCCVCNSGYSGNGAHCFLTNTFEMGLTPYLEVRLMGVDGEWVTLGTTGSNIGMITTLYRSSIDSRFWQYAPVVLAAIPWLFSTSQSSPYSPSVLTGGNFNRTLDVQLTRSDDTSSSQTFRLENFVTIDFYNNVMNIDLRSDNYNDLGVPEFSALRKIVWRYQHRSHGSVNAVGNIVAVDSNDVQYTYSWTETVSFYECGRNDLIGVTDRAIELRHDPLNWLDNLLQFSPTIQSVSGGLEIAGDDEVVVTSSPYAECGGECTGNRQCRVNAETSQYECLCPEGYTDNGDSYANCEPQQDQCGNQCSAESNTYCGPDGVCLCREGFEAASGSDPLTCSPIPVDTCTQSCHEKANCTQVDGQWQCVCQGDYVGNGTQCELSCTILPGACGGINERCNPTSKRCECKAGSKLFKDKRGSFCINSQSCIHAKCRGNMQCVRRDDFNYECICKRDSYFDGSTCVDYTASTNFSSDWLVYAHGVILARGRPDSRGNIIPWPLLVISDQRAVAVATDCSSGHVYWSDVKNKVIRRANLIGDRVLSDVVLTLPRSSSVEGMAFDYVAKNLYYTDAGTDSIVVFNIRTNRTRTIISGVSDPRGMTLDLVNNKMYWVDWDSTNPRVERANLDGSGRSVVVSNSASNPVKYPNGIVVDGFKQFLYWADAGTGQVLKMSTAQASEQTVHFNLENLDRNWEEKRYMLFDITLLRANEVYATVWGMNTLVRTNDQKVFDKAPGGNGKIFGLDYYRATCPPTSSKCAMIEVEDGWKAEQCEKSSQLCFSMGHSDSPSCVCADDSSDC